MIPNEQDRRSIRLRGYDYSLAGAYFITICVNHKMSLLGAFSRGSTLLAPAGEMVKDVLEDMPSCFPEVQLDQFIIMPNHVHVIVVFTWGPVGCGIGPQAFGLEHLQRPRISGASLSDVVRWFKVTTSNKYRASVLSSNWPPYEERLWQRNYYEHIVRDTESLALIRDYIATNPMRWQNDKENPDKLGDDPFDTWFEQFSRKTLGDQG